MVKLYTRHGDEGMTSLMNGVRVSKSDDRIELLGEIDELSAQIGMVKVLLKESEKEKLSDIQMQLIQIMAGIASSDNKEYELKEEKISYIEKEIDEKEKLFSRSKQFILYGGCELSARLDVARAVVRRVERKFSKVKQNYGADKKAMQYMNRLSDYLYVWARYEDYKAHLYGEKQQ